MDSSSCENGPAMSGREVRNLQTSLQVPEFAETTARGQRASARNQSRGRGEPEMEEPKLPAGEPKGESKVNKLNFGKRESHLLLKQKLVTKNSPDLTVFH